jgi:hypothetical protein
MAARQPSDRGWREGQIALAEALLCLECELIYAGILHCPRCGGEVAWPPAGWLSHPAAAEPADVSVPSHRGDLWVSGVTWPSIQFGPTS